MQALASEQDVCAVLSIRAGCVCMRAGLGVRAGGLTATAAAAFPQLQSTPGKAAHLQRLMDTLVAVKVALSAIPRP